MEVAKISELMNGAPVGNPDVIRVLEEALGRARSGQVAGVAIIAAMGPEGLTMTCGGGNVITLSAGCAQMQRQLLDVAFNPKARGNGLLVPVR